MDRADTYRTDDVMSLPHMAVAGNSESFLCAVELSCMVSPRDSDAPCLRILIFAAVVPMSSFDSNLLSCYTPQEPPKPILQLLPSTITGTLRCPLEWASICSIADASSFTS
jgi:hypothetical protein